jgi:hypothetical protein
VLPHTVIYPSAVMVVLFYAHSTNIAVVSSFGYLLNTLKAKFATINQKLINVLLLNLILGNQQATVKQKHDS